MCRSTDSKGVYCKEIDVQDKIGNLLILIDKFPIIVYYQITRLRTFLIFIGNIIPLSKNEDIAMLFFYLLSTFSRKGGDFFILSALFYRHYVTY